MAQFGQSTGTSSDPFVTVMRGNPEDRDPETRVPGGFVCADGLRCSWDDRVTFDMFGGHTIRWQPGKDWNGEFPDEFYSTLTGLLCAWRGSVSLHCTAVDISGGAALIFGGQGAGKSTLAAVLTERGARLISDDLSVLDRAGDGSFHLRAGRPAIRLFEKFADRCAFPQAGVKHYPDRPSKVLVLPPRADAHARLPVRAIFFLIDGETGDRSSLGELSSAQMLFRPRWMTLLPGQRARVERLQSLLRSTPLATIRKCTDIASFEAAADVIEADMHSLSK